MHSADRYIIVNINVMMTIGFTIDHAAHINYHSKCSFQYKQSPKPPINLDSLCRYERTMLIFVSVQQLHLHCVYYWNYLRSPDGALLVDQNALVQTATVFL
uniref:Uncharacterized protein n=1 Tax=Onchocerca volvulus TaxID=6282 RepID=A0A8R1TTD1_ONCVO